MSAVLFKGQDYRLILETGISLAGATLVKAIYTKPSGDKGEWTGTVDGDDIFYDVTAVQNDMDGNWTFQSYVEIGGKVYFGETKIIKISNNLR